ncbi:family 20 glycosylhydrolase [Halalkalibaculum sp. DA384]|uniref:family 20 glycosylhydrolase n=1 Tax=Halalkalibaculum sp. DA384 TaxID=3373606 RepID=UPI0037549ADE
MVRYLSLFLLFFLLLPVFSSGQSTNGEDPPLIPTPQRMECKTNDSRITDFWVDPAADFAPQTRHLKKLLAARGLSEVGNSSGADLSISVQQGVVENPHGFRGAYSVEIRGENHMRIVAPDPSGAFYAFQTVRQLIRNKGDRSFLSRCDIHDWPAFKKRGYMVDVGRNFQSVEQLKQQIDVMANYKMNILHLHLTDNPGWRLESKIYPELQSARATSRKPGKYYSQQDFIELVEYSAERNITVVPELDIPGLRLK